MANKWVEHVKSYAKKHNLKYNEALKDINCKNEYKTGKGYSDVLKVVDKKKVKKIAKSGVDYGADYIKDKIDGMGHKKLGNGIFGDVGSVLGTAGAAFLTKNPIAGPIGGVVAKNIGNKIDKVLGTGKKHFAKGKTDYIGGALYPNGSLN
jgi:phage-related protein